MGPHSAGSEPGPAAYGLGGTQPTVTDADFPARLSQSGILRRRHDVDRHAPPSSGFQAGSPLQPGLVGHALAWGIHDLVNENMANAARVHIAEHGRDPRRYALLSTGGAGPVHAAYVARKARLSSG